MKTDLNARSSIFSKSKESDAAGISARSMVKTPSSSDDYLDINDLIARINLAIEERDAESLPWLQLEVQTRSMILLKMLDWKMWEIHNRYIKP